ILRGHFHLGIRSEERLETDWTTARDRFSRNDRGPDNGRDHPEHAPLRQRGDGRRSQKLILLSKHPGENGPLSRNLRRRGKATGAGRTHSSPSRLVTTRIAEHAGLLRER